MWHTTENMTSRSPDYLLGFRSGESYGGRRSSFAWRVPLRSGRCEERNGCRLIKGSLYPISIGKCSLCTSSAHAHSVLEPVLNEADLRHFHRWTLIRVSPRATRTVVVNELVAATLFPGQSAVGRQIWVRGMMYDIVGVAAQYVNVALQSDNRSRGDDGARGCDRRRGRATNHPVKDLGAQIVNAGGQPADARWRAC
jgi:hypothetical protein